MMNRLNCYRFGFVLLGVLLAAPLLSSANTVTSTSVFTNPPGAGFWVDGQYFKGSASFLWPVGSKHTLDILQVQQVPTAATRYSFNGWTDSTGKLSVSTTQLVITADPSVSS